MPFITSKALSKVKQMYLIKFSSSLFSRFAVNVIGIDAAFDEMMGEERVQVRHLYIISLFNKLKG